MNDMNEAFYACPALRKFPIDSREATENSYGAWSVQRGSFSDAQNQVISKNFTKAASYYGLQLEEPVVEEPREMLMFKGASEHVSMNEITSIDELEKAVDFVIEKRASVMREALAEPAKYILWQASNTDVDMDTPKMRKIAHIAGIGVGDRDKIQREFNKRAHELKLGDENRDALWKYAKDLEKLSDDEFYDEKALNTMCNVLDNIDFMTGNQHKHASEGCPEDVVFESTMDDLLKEASDLYYVPSIGATLSKKATFERADVINSFFKRHFTDGDPVEGQKLIDKIASLDAVTADHLIEMLDE